MYLSRQFERYKDKAQKFTISRHQVSRLAGALAKMGVSRGDRVLVYMPMIPEAIIAMLATVRLGAIHSVVFGGMFSFTCFIVYKVKSEILDTRYITRNFVVCIHFELSTKYHNHYQGESIKLGIVYICES